MLDAGRGRLAAGGWWRLVGNKTGATRLGFAVLLKFFELEALLGRCRAERVEPPGVTRLERVMGAARAAAEQRFCARTVARLSEDTAARLEALAGDEVSGRNALAELKADSGRVGLQTLLREIDKLERIRAPGLPGDLFANASESDLRAAARPVRLTLLAALCRLRAAKITDALVDLLIALVHKISHARRAAFRRSARTTQLLVTRA